MKTFRDYDAFNVSFYLGCHKNYYIREHSVDRYSLLSYAEVYGGQS